MLRSSLCAKSVNPAGYLKLCVDGVLSASTSGGTGSITQENELRLGNNSKLDAPFSGLLDEVKLYNFALNETEVQDDCLTSIETLSQPVPREFILSQNYPNPFNPTTKIEFTCPKRSQVTLEIYDISGKRVAILIDDVREAGRHSINFDGSNLSSGVYMYKLTSTNGIAVRKMLLVK